MKKLLVALVLALSLAGSLTVTAGAHPRDIWYWSTAAASNELNKGFCAGKVCHNVAWSYCRGHANDPLNGQPAWEWNKQHNLRLFKHHDCWAHISNGAIWYLLLHVKGKTAWEGANLRLVRRAGSAPPPLPPPPPSSGSVYVDTGSGHWIQDVSSDGSVITLEDRSTWLVDPIGQIDTQLWLPVDNITVLDGTNPSYPYRLVNPDENGEVVDARFLGYR